MKSRFITSLFAVVLALSVTTAFSAEKLKPMAGTQDLNFTFMGFATMGLGGATASVPNTLTPSGTMLPPPPITVGYDYYLSNQMSLNLGLGFNQMSSKQDSTSPSQNGGESSMMGLTVLAGVGYHLIESGPLAPYWAGGINYTMLSGTAKASAGSAESKQSGSVFGVTAALGIEWFIEPSVSLSGEYRLGFQTGSVTTTPAGGTEVKGPTNTQIGTTNTAALILRLYF